MAKRKELVGKVVPSKMAKTIVVEVTSLSSHPIYKRLVKTRKKYFVHLPEEIELDSGTKVRIRESRPMASKKRWVFVSKES